MYNRFIFFFTPKNPQIFFQEIPYWLKKVMQVVYQPSPEFVL